MPAPSPDEREEKLRERLERIEALEKEVKAREKALKKAETAKKQIVLRLSSSLWDDIAAWAEEDFRSITARLNTCSPKPCESTRESEHKKQEPPANPAALSVSKWPRRVLRQQGAKGTYIIFGGGVYVAENTFREASVELFTLVDNRGAERGAGLHWPRLRPGGIIV